MRKLSFLLLSGAISIASFAQTSLPTSWDCSGTPPTGWSQVQTGAPGNLNYTSADLFTSTPSSVKLDNTGEYVQVEINENPGLVKYNIKGAVGNVASWTGTFKTQWSADGNTWTDMATFTSLPIKTAAFLNEVDTPAAQARFIRFFFSNKAQGCNVALDDILVELPAAGPDQEVDVWFDTIKTVMGSNIWFSSAVGTPASFKLKVYNLGSDSILTLSNVAINGPAAGDYALGSFPSSIAPLDSGEINFTFTPSVAGTRVVELSFNSNDADESSYLLNLFGVGGNFATEPAQNPTALTFVGTKSYGFGANVTGNNADGFIVLRKLGSPVTDVPADGVVYTLGEGIGASKVFYVGNGSTFPVKEVRADLTYYFAVFSFNGSGSYTNYKTTAPLQASKKSGNAAPGSYYTAIVPTSNNFVTDLSTLINNRSIQFYGNYKATMIDGFYSRDTANGQKVVNCEYSNELVEYTEPFDFTGLNMAREHTFASSWMPTFGTGGHTERYGYSDYHNLHLTNQNDVNAPRGNFGFGDVATVTTTYLESKIGKDSANSKVFEPRAEIKGDVARAIFYMSVCFNREPNKATFSSNLPPVINTWQWDSLIVPGVVPNPDMALYLVQSEALLKKWNQQDPPSAEERARNEFVFDIQGNRNPFIDNPDWVCLINFKDMTYNAAGVNQCYNGQTAVKEISAISKIKVYPVPANSSLTVELTSQENYSAKIQLVDLIGNVVLETAKELNTGSNVLNFNTANLSSGNYILKVSGKGASVQRKIIIMQ
ncbi:MAG: hypothetical protein BGO32_12770 [Bacteroidetes bacterium 37-13]|nr:MAG: hypothetical protein BGO32_12770 [Bacteroidetes bacterium 37-13]